MPLPTGYSLWLDFDQQSYDRLEACIRFWSVLEGTPAFSPHLTVLGEVGSDFQSLEARVREVTRSIVEFDFQMGARGVGTPPFQSRYLNVRPCTALDELRSRLATAMAIEPKPFFPHISLQYCEQAPESLRAWASESDPLLDHVVMATGLSIVLTEGETCQWDVAASYAFQPVEDSAQTD